MKKRRKTKIIARGRVGEAICNRAKSKLLLQKNEGIIQWIGLKAATSIVGEHIFRKYIPFTQRHALKILGYAEKKTILSCLENSCFEEQTLWTNGEKSEPF